MLFPVKDLFVGGIEHPSPGQDIADLFPFVGRQDILEFGDRIIIFDKLAATVLFCALQAITQDWQRSTG